jgi:outer membrane murein-binding lipoprotein Lpp
VLLHPSQVRLQEVAVEEGAQRVEQLNAVINRVEAEMLAVRRQYKAAIEGRNATGE